MSQKREREKRVAGNGEDYPVDSAQFWDDFWLLRPVLAKKRSILSMALQF